MCVDVDPLERLHCLLSCSAPYPRSLPALFFSCLPSGGSLLSCSQPFGQSGDHIEKAPGGMSTEGLVVEYLKRAVPRRRLGRGSSTTKQAHDDVT